MTWNIVLRPRNDFKFEKKNEIIFFVIVRIRNEIETKMKKQRVNPSISNVQTKSANFQRKNNSLVD